MPEREPQILEKINLNERGGLTPKHWHEVVNRLGKYKNLTNNKIIAYAHKVISGEFPSEGFHHRNFLGNRHWLSMSSIDSKDKVRTPRRFPPWPKISYIKNPKIEEIKSYAKSEILVNFTLDDYIAEVNRKSRSDDGNQEFVWDSKKKHWDEYRIDYFEDSGGAGMGYYAWEERSLVENVDQDNLLNLWLLTEEQVDDPIHKSPDQLVELLKKTSTEVLNLRLKERLGKRTNYFHRVGNWEKEI